MPETLGEWLLLFGLALFSVLGYVNTIFAMLGLTASIILGVSEGFDIATVAACSLFGFLFFGELLNFLLAKPEIILKSVWPNLLKTIDKLIWLSLVALLLYRLSWDEGLTKYYWVYISIATTLIITNLPSMILHAALCVPKFRQYIGETDEEIKRRVQNDNTHI